MLYADDTTVYHSCPDPQELQGVRQNYIGINVNFYQVVMKCQTPAYLGLTEPLF